MGLSQVIQLLFSLVGQGMIIGVDPHLQSFPGRLAQVAITFPCNGAEPVSVSSAHRDGHPVAWVLFGVFISILVCHRTKDGCGRECWPPVLLGRRLNRTLIKSRILVKKAKFVLFCRKNDLRIRFEKIILFMRFRQAMNQKNYETFELTKEQYEALKIIERETKIPVDVQLMHAHLMWVARKQKRRLKQ